nr:glycosyltransferase [Flexivirga meconopsidis]
MHEQPTAASQRPLLWSVVIPVHNCAGYLAEALPEVLDQLGGDDRAEIIVVDDASTDDPEAVVRELGRDQVRYERNPRQLGAIGTFNRGISLASGELVHLLHGDDEVLPGFYPAVAAALDGTTAVAAMCRTVDIDAAGNRLRESRSYRRGTGVWPGAFEAFVRSNRVRAPGIVVRRSAYEQFGTFREDLPHAADWELWTRLARSGPVVFVDEVLAAYRKHGESDTSARMRTGANIIERESALSIISQHVDVRRRRTTIRWGLLYSFVYATRTGVTLARDGQWQAAAAQWREGGRCLLHVPGALRHGYADDESSEPPVPGDRSLAA